MSRAPPLPLIMFAASPGVALPIRYGPLILLLSCCTGTFFWRCHAVVVVVPPQIVPVFDVLSNLFGQADAFHSFFVSV